MKIIHPPTKPILPSELYTKSAYAKLIKKSPYMIDKLIDKGEVVVVPINGVDLVKRKTVNQ